MDFIFFLKIIFQALVSLKTHLACGEKKKKKNELFHLWECALETSSTRKDRRTGVGLL